MFSSTLEGLPPIAGDPYLQVKTHDVPTYEELHSEVQSILVPSSIPPGIQVNVTAPLANTSLAVSTRFFMMSEKKEQNPFAALFGGGGKPKDDKPTRLWSLGGVFAHRFGNGGGLRLFSQIDTANLVKTTTLCRLPTAAGALSLSAQTVSEKRPGGGPWPSVQYGLTAALRGMDYSATVRAASSDEPPSASSPFSLPDLGVSYLQRLSAGSPLMLGGELWFSPSTFRAVRRSPGPAQDNPLNWAVGAAYDTGLSKSSLHFSNTGVNKPLVNMQHYHQVTKNSSLVAKMITDLGLSRSMAAAGYKVSFPNTATDVLGMADTYGGVRIRVDREMMRDMKASFFLHYNATATATGKDVADDPNAFGIKVTIGKQPTFDPSLSPCTMNRVQFRIQ